MILQKGKFQDSIPCVLSAHMDEYINHGSNRGSNMSTHVLFKFLCILSLFLRNE